MDQKEKLLSLVNNFGEQLLDWLRNGGDFVKDQAPLVCQEIVKFGQFYHTLFLIILAPLTVALCVIGKKIFNKYKETQHYKKIMDEPYSIVSVFSFIGALISFTFIIVNIYWLAMTIYAPRLYLINELKELLK